MSKLKEVDLNLRHYAGGRSDVIKEVKNRIVDYLRNPDIPQVKRAIYSAIYNALTYYQNVSDLSISGESAEKTFLENILKDFNENYRYLSEKYNSKDPKLPKVIEVKGRIKSPISAMNKILEKVTEYVKEGRDLTKLNESLRDFIGLRIIINPPPEIKAQGKQAESDYCYAIFDDLMRHKGIGRQINNDTPEDTDYEFLPVNTEHDPDKQKKIMERPQKEGFAFIPEKEGVFIPTTRPDFVEGYSHLFKDYRMYPKLKLYQRLHICAKPFFSKLIPEEIIPNFIIPAKTTEPAIEFQMCLHSEEEFAEHGKSAHTEYKDRSFHVLSIPITLFYDDNLGKIRTGRLDESMEEFYGYSFKDRFNIDYQPFLRTFDSQQRNDILAGKSQVTFNDDTNEYMVSAVPRIFITDQQQTPQFVTNLLKSASKEDLQRFYEVNGLLDSTVYPLDVKPSPEVTVANHRIKIYRLDTRFNFKVLRIQINHDETPDLPRIRVHGRKGKNSKENNLVEDPEK